MEPGGLRSCVSMATETSAPSLDAPGGRDWRTRRLRHLTYPKGEPKIHTLKVFRKRLGQDILQSGCPRWAREISHGVLKKLERGETSERRRSPEEDPKGPERKQTNRKPKAGRKIRDGKQENDKYRN